MTRGLCGIAVVLLAAATGPGAAAGFVNTSERGWYDDTGLHLTDNTNYITGYIPGDPDFPDEAPAETLRSFFTFDLAGQALPLLQASLFLYNPGGPDDFGPGYNSPDASETFTLFGVTTPAATLADGTGGTDAYADLGAGPVYGSVVMTAADNGRFVRIDLNADGLAALNAARGGAFTLGGSLTSRSGQTTSVESVFGYSGFRYGFPGSPADGDTYLSVTPVPAPPAAALALMGLATAGGLSHVRRRAASS